MKTNETKVKNIAYVPIYDPVSFRRHILLSGIDIIKILEKYESLKKIRNEKRKSTSELKQKMFDLNHESLFLKELLPEISKGELKEEAKEVEKKVEKIKYPKTTGTYRDLKRELNELQHKLNKLNF